MAALALASILPAIHAPPAAAQDAPATPEVNSSTPGSTVDPTPQERATNQLWSRANLLGDLGGRRARLEDRGVRLGLQEVFEVLGNPTGGVRRATVFEGLAQLSLKVDTDKAISIPGGTINITAFQIHGRGLSLNALGNNLNTVSSLEAERGFLLFEAWYEQAMLGGKLTVRLGQLAADQEFMVSQYANLFVNHTFGWSTFPSVNLPSGGPSYPLATPGIRVKAQLDDATTVMLGVFNGDPAGRGPGTPQSRDRTGANFRLNDDVLVLLEAQYQINQGTGATGLAGTYKAGAYYHGGRFSDQRRNAEDESLANPLDTDLVPRARRHDYGLYAIADQLVWQTGKDAGIGVFARLMGGPGDRNLVNFYADAGVTWKGALPSRPDDTMGLAFGIARISDTASKLDSDAARFTGSGNPIRRHESVLELSYQAQFAPWLQVQPSAQYVFNPGGSVNDPDRPGKRIGDALVLGLRTSVIF